MIARKLLCVITVLAVVGSALAGPLLEGVPETAVKIIIGSSLRGQDSSIANRAALELRRSLRISTGHLAEFSDVIADESHRSMLQIVLDIQGSGSLRRDGAQLAVPVKSESPEAFSIRGAKKVVACVCASSGAVPHCVSRLLREMGVRSHLHGDSRIKVPLETVIKRLLKLPKDLPHTIEPAFTLRGIQPFHDFAEGPDWWTAEDYKLHLSQMNKLGMNFIGLHTYPYNANLGTGTNEPTVWVGEPKDIGKKDKVYPVSYQNTMRTEWGYQAVPTSQYTAGADRLFERECFSSVVQDEAMCPYPKTKEDAATVLQRTGDLLKDAFDYAHSVNVKTCVGVETPLSKPFNGTADSEVYFEGIFKRIMQTYDIDYFWLWTPEAWEWDHVNVTDHVVQDAVHDLLAAHKARTAVGGKFDLATCGWVVGPQGDRSYLDSKLPNDYLLSSIDMNLGQTDVDPAYKKIKNHESMVIPWMEDDPGLTAPQLWVNRTINHAKDALKYGATGLLGIHWRTRAIGPQISVMSAFAWNTSISAADYWRDWAVHEFGNAEFAKIFTAVDSFNLPRPVDWVDGPGRIKADNAQCAYPTAYAFVDGFLALTPEMSAGPYSRYIYWANTFQYMRAIAETSCNYYRLSTILTTIAKLENRDAQRIAARTQALPLRIALVESSTRMVTHLLETVSNTGEMGTVANIVSSSVKPMMDATGPALEKLLGDQLPTAAQMDRTYRGSDRVVVITARDTLDANEDLSLRATVLTARDIFSVTIYARHAGSSDTPKAVPMQRQGSSGVFTGVIPTKDYQAQKELEYYVHCQMAGADAYWPERIGEVEWFSVVLVSEVESTTGVPI